jgi:serine/threonine protein kinase/formylglycine-generating enzyme required for sulfatase activity
MVPEESPSPLPAEPPVSPSSSDPAESLLARWLAEREAGGASDLEAWLAAQGDLAADPDLGEAVRAAWRRWQALEPLLRAGLPGRGAGSRAFFRGRERERPQPTPGLASGKVVGDFRLLSLIGQGGMGQVWEAEQVSLHRTVAVKFVRPERVTERQLELFAREARAGGRLHHPGIVTVHGYGQSDGLAWIAMEHVEGAWTLKDFLDEAARADEVPEGYDAHVARLVAEIADAMQAAHAAGVIHRDLKPQNVLITEEDHPKVTDFGLARITDESALSATGDFAGTYFYMSPEQVTARRMGLDHRTDVFSLGVVLYELLALRRPFEGDTSHQVAAQIVTKDPPDVRTIRSRVPRDLAVIAGKALEKDRDKRFQTMRDFAADLRRHLADEPILARPPTQIERVVKWTRRNPGKSSAAAIVAVTFTIIALLLAANVRTNQALATERTNLASANTELAATAEREKAAADLARTNEERAVLGESRAKDEAARADREADEAKRKRDEVLRLSALQDLEDLKAAAERLWPAHPENLERYRDWLAEAETLVASLPGHESNLSELRARAVTWSEEERAAHRAAHPEFPRLEKARRHLEFHRKQDAAFESGEPLEDPAPEEVGVDFASLPSDASGLNALAWELVKPDRGDWGGEAKALVLARRAVALAAELPAPERAQIRDTLAWALFAAGRFDEAMAEEEQAVEEAEGEGRAELEKNLEKLREEIEEHTTPEGAEKRAEHLAGIEREVERLDEEIEARPDWLFADSQDKWWHNQLEKLVEGLKRFSDPKSGLASNGTSAEHGWGVAKRAEFARTIAERSTTGAEASARWAEAIASIASVSECPPYEGLRITPQLGLLPIGRDPASGLWEFAHLQTGEPAERGADGKLVLTESTGLVLVLLPGGTFTMGAQRNDPNGPNYDPEAQSNEGPPHEVELSPYFLSKYEMTQGQWQRFTDVNPSYYHRERYSPGWNRGRKGWTALHPVEQVSWFDCEAAMKRLGLLLPSEAQWEYGARAGTKTVWWTGNEKQALAQLPQFAEPDWALTRSYGVWSAGVVTTRARPGGEQVSAGGAVDQGPGVGSARPERARA